jgi:DNA-directed RNA polymerase specialized sigma24 family protein
MGETTMVDSQDNNGQHGGFAKESDEELLLYMAERQTYPASARGAWEEFYRRHAKYVHWVCRRVCGGSLDDDTVNGIVVDTFTKAYQSAGTFRFSNEKQPDKVRRRVRAWLGVIAKHATFDAFGGHREPRTVQLDAQEWEGIDGDRGEGLRYKDTQTVRGLMEQVLNDRERLVLQMTYMHYDPDRENQRLSDDVVHRLCECLHTTPANLRRIRKNATDKMREALISAGYKNHKHS